MIAHTQNKRFNIVLPVHSTGKARKALKMIKICDICENLYIDDSATMPMHKSIYQTLCQRCNAIMHYIDAMAAVYSTDEKAKVIKAFESFSESDRENDNFLNFVHSQDFEKLVKSYEK